MNDFDVLEKFTALESDDMVKRDLELTCNECGTVVCDIEHGDLLSMLANTADQHWQEKHGNYCPEHGDPPHRHDSDGNPSI